MSRIRGAAPLRRLMKRMPDAVQAEIVAALGKWGAEIAIDMRSRARFHSRTGRLLSRINFRVYPGTMKMQVGILGSQVNRSKVFYGRILDLGRKAQVVTVTRGRQWRGAYQMRVSPIAPMRFVSGPITDLRAGLRRNLTQLWEKALARIGDGGAND